jgi:hypothetical protein
MSTTNTDAGLGRQVPTVTRRSMIRTGGLAALAATVAGFAAPTPPAQAAPLLPAATDVPLIDRAEALVVELQQIMLQLDGETASTWATSWTCWARLLPCATT